MRCCEDQAIGFRRPEHLWIGVSRLHDDLIGLVADCCFHWITQRRADFASAARRSSERRQSSPASIAAKPGTRRRPRNLRRTCVGSLPRETISRFARADSFAGSPRLAICSCWVDRAIGSWPGEARGSRVQGPSASRPYPTGRLAHGGCRDRSS